MGFKIVKAFTASNSHPNHAPLSARTLARRFLFVKAVNTERTINFANHILFPIISTSYIASSGCSSMYLPRTTESHVPLSIVLEWEHIIIRCRPSPRYVLHCAFTQLQIHAQSTGATTTTGVVFWCKCTLDLDSRLGSSHFEFRVLV